MFGSGDPGGAIRRWFANSVGTVMPRESFINRKTLLVDPRFTQPDMIDVRDQPLKEIASQILIPIGSSE